MNDEVILHDQTTELVIQSQNGDMQAFRQLVEQHQSYAYKIAYHILHCEEDARDVVQESFVRVWQNLSRFRAKTKFTTWLYRIVVNKALDTIRQKKRRKHVAFNESSENEFADFEKNPESLYLNQESRKRIQEAVNRLPERQRMVFILRDFQELSIKEVSQILKCTPQNVKSQLYYARRKLRKLIEKNEGVL